jgi:hypothetical protein
VDLIKMGNPLAIRFIVKKPSTSYIKNIFVITFNTSVWIASMVVMIIAAVVVKMILNWEAKHKEVVSSSLFFFYCCDFAEGQTKQVHRERRDSDCSGGGLPARLLSFGKKKRE